MSEATHTPGTWTNKKYSTFVWSEHGNICVCGDPHASGHVGYTEIGPGSQYLGEAVANACLIAAARDYDAAARMLLAGLPDETFQYRETLTKSEVEHLNAAIQMFKAAVAKAEGRSP